MAGPLLAAALFLGGPASAMVGAAVVVLVIPARETVAIAAIVFVWIGERRSRRERQNDGACGDRNRELQR